MYLDDHFFLPLLNELREGWRFTRKLKIMEMNNKKTNDINKFTNKNKNK